MTGEIVRIIKGSLAKPVLESVQKIGQTVPKHFGDIGDRLEKTSANHAKNEADVASKIKGVRQSRDAGTAAHTTSAAPAPRGPGGGEHGSVEPPPLKGGGDPVRDGHVPGAQGASADPVDLVSGQMFLPQRDLVLPGVLGLALERMHRSDYRAGRWFGLTWASTLDQRIEIDEDGIHYAAPDGVVLHYPIPTQPGQRVQPSEGARWTLAWDRGSDTIVIEQPESGWTLHFPPGPTPQQARPLQAHTDRNGNRITFTHDDEGVPTGVYHSGGYRLAVDSEMTTGGPRITALRLVDPAGGADTTVVAFRYDALARLTDVVNSSGLPLVFEYDEQERITGWTDRNGHSYGYRYDEAGRVAQAQGTGGYLAATLAYDLDARATTLTDSLGHATVYHWNESGQTVKVADPSGGVTLAEQDRYNRRLSTTDPLGRTTRYVRDEHGDPVRIEHPDGTAVQIAYNELRRPIAVTGADGAVWQYTYDERGNLLTVTDPLGAVTAHEYDERGALIGTTDALGRSTRYETNAAGLPIAVTDALGAQERVEYDPFGRPTGTTDALGAVTRARWTVEGLLAQVIAPDDARQEWAYDGEGNLIEYRDASGGVTGIEYGPFDEPVARTDPSGARYRFDYDTELRLTRVTNAAGREWRYEYDAADNPLSETDFNGRTLTYRYDAANRLVERVNGAGQTSYYLRDLLGRVTERRSADASVHRFGYDAAGRLLRAESPGSTLEHVRDALGRILVETVDGRALVNEYDLLGRRVRRTTPTGGVSQWSYDAAGLPATLATATGGLTFQHDAQGRETTRYLGSGAALSQGFDAAGRLTAQAIWAYGQTGQNTPEPTLQQQRTYTYRPDGLPVEVADHLRGTRHYELDRIGRITAVHAATWSETYAYDALGNLAQAALPQEGGGEVGGDVPEREYTGTLVRRTARTTYEHDAQGRVVRTARRTLSGQTRQTTYTWNADDRLTEVATPDGTWRYRYDPLGRRIAKQRIAEDASVAQEILFAWDGVQLAEQTATAPDGRTDAISWDWEPGGHRAAAQTHRSWAADAPQETVDTAFYAIVTDLVGTPAELVAPDGRVAWYQTTSLWGVPIAAPNAETDCPLRFPGQYHDPETGLDYNHHRYYDPEAGAYVSPDPLGLAPAPNHHAYVANPLAQIDPLGLAAYPRGTDYNGLSAADKASYDTLQTAVANSAARTPAQIRANLSARQLVVGKRIKGLRSTFVGSEIEKGVGRDPNVLADPNITHMGTAWPGRKVPDFQIGAGPTYGIDVTGGSETAFNKHMQRPYITHADQIMTYPSVSAADLDTIFA